jgi:hypothetical protein
LHADGSCPLVSHHTHARLETVSGESEEEAFVKKEEEEKPYFQLSNQLCRSSERAEFGLSCFSHHANMLLQPIIGL